VWTDTRYTGTEEKNKGEGACWGWDRKGEKKGRDGATIYLLENKKAYLN
jgi:hypothetical protein